MFRAMFSVLKALLCVTFGVPCAIKVFALRLQTVCWLKYSGRLDRFGVCLLLRMTGAIAQWLCVCSFQHAPAPESRWTVVSYGAVEQLIPCTLSPLVPVLCVLDGI